MTERIETVPLQPEDTQGRGWFTNRHGVDEGRLVQPPVLDAPFADPKFAGNGGTWPGFER